MAASDLQTNIDAAQLLCQCAAMHILMQCSFAAGGGGGGGGAAAGGAEEKKEEKKEEPEEEEEDEVSCTPCSTSSLHLLGRCLWQSGSPLGTPQPAACRDQQFRRC